MTGCRSGGGVTGSGLTHLPSFFSWAIVPLTLLEVAVEAAMAATRTAAAAGREGRRWALLLERRATACCLGSDRTAVLLLGCCLLLAEDGQCATVAAASVDMLVAAEGLSRAVSPRSKHKQHDARLPASTGRPHPSCASLAPSREEQGRDPASVQ